MPTMAAARHRSSATPLALAYAALVVYASLYPFTGWRWPPGQTLATMAALVWPPWRDDFDSWSNLLGYLPLGALLLIAARRSGVRGGAVAAAGAGRAGAAVVRHGGAAALRGRPPSVAQGHGLERRRRAGRRAAGVAVPRARAGRPLARGCANAGSRATAPARWRCWRCGRWPCCSRHRCPSGWARSASACARPWPAGCRTCPGPRRRTRCWPRRRRRPRRCGRWPRR